MENMCIHCDSISIAAKCQIFRQSSTEFLIFTWSTEVVLMETMNFTIVCAIFQSKQNTKQTDPSFDATLFNPFCFRVNPLRRKFMHGTFHQIPHQTCLFYCRMKYTPYLLICIESKGMF